MLRSVGYQCYFPSKQIQDEMHRIGCDTVYSVDWLVRAWGYEPPLRLPDADIRMMDSADLFVDVKGVRSYDKIVNRWPHLDGRVLWYRINGGEPEHVIRNDGFDCGDERNPPCPILTPNRWYKEEGPWSDRSYSCWPPFYRYDEYYLVNGRSTQYTNPICLIHNLQGWGYGALTDSMRQLGVKCYGNGSPDGLIQHSEIPKALSTAKAMVHLKSSDAPGYALLEGLAAGCPLVVTRRLIWRSHMEDLFIPGENCFVFDRETHDGLSEQDVKNCTREVSVALGMLSEVDCNQRIGMAGREHLGKLMWSERSEEDVGTFRAFMERNFE